MIPFTPGEVGLATASDEVILDWCRRDRRVGVTRDADFHAILARTGGTSPSVIRIRIEPLSDDEMVRIIEWIVSEKSADLRRGVAMSVKERSLRIHELPLTPIGAEHV